MISIKFFVSASKKWPPEFYKVFTKIFFKSSCKVFSLFFQSFSKISLWCFPVSLKLFQKHFLKFLHNIKNMNRTTTFFPNNVPIIFLASFKIFFSNFIKFLQNFLAFSSKFHKIPQKLLLVDSKNFKNFL